MLKKIIPTLLAIATASTLVHADDLMQTGRIDAVNPSTKEKQSVEVFGRVNVGNEYNVVRYFFTYTCDFGEKYDEEMSIWGSTLPKNFHYVRVPVLTQEPNSLVGAFAYYAAWSVDKSKINAFQKNAYYLIKNKNFDPSSQKTFLIAAKAAGYNAKTYMDAWSTTKTKNLVKNAAILGAKYNIRYTPTLTVGGIYTINPEPIADSRTSFVDFANAITSKYISENKAALQ